MEEYLTTFELSERIKLAPGTIRNLVWRKEFKKNIIYGNQVLEKWGINRLSTFCVIEGL